jgi:hypothetical protein
MDCAHWYVRMIRLSSHSPLVNATLHLPRAGAVFIGGSSGNVNAVIKIADDNDGVEMITAINETVEYIKEPAI